LPSARGLFMSDKKTAIVTGAQQGIGAGLVEEFLRQGYNVVGTSLRATATLTASPTLALVDGDIGKLETAAKAVEAAINRFGSIDVLVNNAGIFYVKPFTEFTTEDFNAWPPPTCWDSCTSRSSPSNRCSSRSPGTW
jgi:NAD(P)-dependent dehydrogenase (short-subunit alcohol dehydrogenase family)